MPIDGRKVADQNERITDNVKAMSGKLQNLDPKNYEQSSSTVKVWAGNVRELKSSLEDQQGLSNAMRDNQRNEDAQQGDSFRDKFRFLLDRIKQDIRYFFHESQTFVDLPQDSSHQKTWDHALHDMEMELKTVSASGADNMQACLDPLVTLLNYRDTVMSLLLNALLFQKAVLDWDLNSQRTYADKPMCDMFDFVVDTFTKTEMVPAKYVMDVPKIIGLPGTFTYDSKQEAGKELGQTVELTSLQARLVSVLKEMQSLDKGLRNMKFGEQVLVPDKHKGTNKNVAADQLRIEVTRWYDKFKKAEDELQASKAQRHTPWELQVEELTKRCLEKDTTNKQHVTKIHKLEGDLQTLRYELTAVRRERSELAEKNNKMMKENLPVLDRIDKLQQKSGEAVERLTADAEMLSCMFRTQAVENRKNIDEVADKNTELVKLSRQLKGEKLKIQFKEEELQKKETLYLRTMAARKSMHESYLEQKAKIKEMDDKMAKREADWQEMLKVLEGRDSEIKQLKQDLRRAHSRIDELEQQKKMCMQEFKRMTGQPYHMLLEQFKAEPTIPESIAFDG